MSAEPELTTDLPADDVLVQDVPETEEAVAETTEASADEADGEEKPEDKGKAKTDGVHKRINELTRARREAEREAEYLRGIVKQLTPVTPAEKPDRDDFADDDDHREAIAEWTATNTVVKMQQTQAEQSASRAKLAAWDARVEETKAAIPDYDTIVPASTTPIKSHVVDAVMDSDHGPALAYHLAKNPDLVARLNDMSPTRAAIELGKLEASVTAPAVKKPSNAPAPITPITSQSSGRNLDLSKSSMDEYVAERRRQGARF